MNAALKFALPLLVVCVASARADTVITYHDSGIFSASTPSDPFGFSGPKEAWSFSFQADINPVVTDVGMGGFSFSFSDFSYFLAGSPVAISPTFIRFFSGTNGGGFAICFDGATFGTCSEGLATDGPQMYTGTTAAPTLLPGTFVQDGLSLISDSITFAEPNTALVGNVPEPSTFLMLGTALLALGWRRLFPLGGSIQSRSRRGSFRPTSA